MRKAAFSLATFIVLTCFSAYAEKMGGGKGASKSQDTSVDSAAVVNALSRYIQVPSVSGKERDAGLYFMHLCRNNGLHITPFTLLDSAFNFAASLYPLSSGKPNIVLMHHIDVVPGGDTADWKFKPFSGKVADGYVYGRGALDVKSLGIMQLYGLLEYLKNLDLEQRYNVTLLAVSGEETGGKNGSEIVVNRFLKDLNPLVVLGEGGSGLEDILKGSPKRPVFGISVAEKRNLWLNLELKFKSNGHGAAPPFAYVNRLMLKSLNKLDDRPQPLVFNTTNKRMFHTLGQYESGLTGYGLRHIQWRLLRPLVKKQIRREPLLGAMMHNTVTLTNVFNPPGAPNQISEKATAILDCRLLPGVDTERFIKQLKFGLFEPRYRVSIIDEGINAPESSPENPAYTAFEMAIKDEYPEAVVVPTLFPATTDNNYFRAKGIPTYGCVPALVNREELEGVHGSDEKISVKGLLKGVKVIAHFLNRMMPASPGLAR